MKRLFCILFFLPPMLAGMDAVPVVKNEEHYRQVLEKVQSQVATFNKLLKEIDEENTKRAKIEIKLREQIIELEQELHEARSFSHWRDNTYTRSTAAGILFLYQYATRGRSFLIKKSAHMKPSIKKTFLAWCALDLKSIWQRKKIKRKSGSRLRNS